MKHRSYQLCSLSLWHSLCPFHILFPSKTPLVHRRARPPAGIGAFWPLLGMKARPTAAPLPGYHPAACILALVVQGSGQSKCQPPSDSQVSPRQSCSERSVARIKVQRKEKQTLSDHEGLGHGASAGSVTTSALGVGSQQPQKLWPLSIQRHPLSPSPHPSPLVLGFSAQTILPTCKLLAILSCPAQGLGLRLDFLDFPGVQASLPCTLPALCSDLRRYLSYGIGC